MFTGNATHKAYRTRRSLAIPRSGEASNVTGKKRRRLAIGKIEGQ